MIVQRLGAANIGTQPAQRGKEFLGSPDPCESQHRRSGPVHTCFQWVHFACHVGHRNCIAPTRGELGLRFGCTQRQHQIGTAQARSHGFAQGASGQAAAVAKAHGGIHDNNGKIF